MHSMGYLPSALFLLLLITTGNVPADCGNEQSAAMKPLLQDLTGGEVTRRVQQFLMAAGGYVDEIDGQPGETLHQAIKAFQQKSGIYPDGEVTELLLIKLSALSRLQPDSLFANAAAGRLRQSPQELSADPTLNARDENGWTPLLYATLEGREKVVATLLKAGADVDMASHYGTNPLMVAVIMNRTQILKLLLDQWPDLERADYQGQIAEEIAFKQRRHRLLTRFRLHREAMARTRIKRRPPFKVRLITWDDQVCYQARMARVDVDCVVDAACQLEKNSLLLCDERGEKHFAALTQVVQRMWGGKPVAVDGRVEGHGGPLRCREGDIILMGIK